VSEYDEVFSGYRPSKVVQFLRDRRFEDHLCLHLDIKKDRKHGLLISCQSVVLSASSQKHLTDTDVTHCGRPVPSFVSMFLFWVILFNFKGHLKG
jgi:hypothetical protein